MTELHTEPSLSALSESKNDLVEQWRAFTALKTACSSFLCLTIY